MKPWFASALGFLVVLAPLVASSPVTPQEVATRIIAQGGSVERDGDGRIVEVFLGNTWATDGDVERLASLGDLRRLDLSLTYVSDRGIDGLRRLEGLQELNLFAAEFITDTALSYLRGHSNLRKLNLRGTDVTDVAVEYVAELRALRTLDISFTQIGDIGMEHIDRLSELEELRIGGNKITGVGLRTLQLLPNLRALSLTGLQRRNAGRCWAVSVREAELETLATLKALRHIDLGRGVGLGGSGTGRPQCDIEGGGIRVTDMGLEKLKTLENLQSIELSGAEITTAGLASVLPAWRELRRLSLWNIEGLDDGVAIALTELERLEVLDLSRTSLTDEGLMTLANIPSLRRLYVSRTNVTAPGVAAFRDKHPQCWISWYDSAGAGEDAKGTD